MNGLSASDSDARMMVFSGNANPILARNIVDQLRLQLGNAIVTRFSDGEVQAEIMENVRGKDVFVVQPTCAPTNDNLMELLVMIDAVRRSSAYRITAVVPYFGYARVNESFGWLGRTHVYRFHISDPIYFNKSLKFTIEHGHNNCLTLDLASVAYWYQQAPAAELPPLPDADGLEVI